MTKIETENSIILTADEGKYLFNGKTYGTRVILPLSADHFVWCEVTEDELPKPEDELM